MSILRNLLVKAGLSERRNDGRMHARGLDVSYWNGLEHKRVKIKDISATGVYLLTKDHLPFGTPVQLVLQTRALLDRDSHREVRLRARCVRQGEDGIGLTFVDEPAKAADWSKSMAIAAELHAGSHPVRLFRSTKALAFLMHIAPDSETQFLQLIAEIGKEQAERMMDVLILADELLSSRNSGPAASLSPNLLLRILEYGSKASGNGGLQCWAGLLASCCLDKQQDDDIGRLVVLLSKLDRDHFAILAAACDRAMRTGWQAGFVFSSPLVCSADEVRNLCGIRNPVAVERNLNYLYQFGLMEQTVRALGCAQLEQVNITPHASRPEAICQKPRRCRIARNPRGSFRCSFRLGDGLLTLPL